MNGQNYERSENLRKSLRDHPIIFCETPDELALGDCAVAVLFAEPGTGTDANLDTIISNISQKRIPIITAIDSETYFSTLVPEKARELKVLVWKDDKHSLLELKENILKKLGLTLDPRLKRVFISYRKRDGSEFAQIVCENLQEYAPFYDDRVLETADPVEEMIVKNLKDRSALVFIETPFAYESKWIHSELLTAITIGLAIIVVTLPGVDPDKSQILARGYAKIMWDGKNFDFIQNQLKIYIDDAIRRSEERKRRIHQSLLAFEGAMDLTINKFCGILYNNYIFCFTPEVPTIFHLYELDQTRNSIENHLKKDLIGILAHTVDVDSISKYEEALFTWSRADRPLFICAIYDIEDGIARLTEILKMQDPKQVPFYTTVPAVIKSEKVLSGKKIFLSAGIPVNSVNTETVDPEEMITAVNQLVGSIWHSGGQLIFGGQPNITPIIAELGKRTRTKVRPPAIIYQSEFFRGKEPEHVYTPEVFGEIKWIEVKPDPPEKQNKEASLHYMRVMMMEEQLDGAIFIGGAIGIRKEFILFLKKHPTKPIFIITKPGGEAKLLNNYIKEQKIELNDQITVTAEEKADYRKIAKHIVKKLKSS